MQIDNSNDSEDHKQINGMPKVLLPQLQKAINQALCSNYIFKHGSIVLKNGKPCGKGFNRLKTDPNLLRRYNYTSRHAECQALINAKHRGDCLIIIRVTRRGNLSMSRPCEKCIKYIKENSSIRKIYFSNWKGAMEKLDM
ncbi:MAG: hypothetical protein AABY22_13250 [Nanoarchaeota archaeon]